MSHRKLHAAMIGLVLFTGTLASPVLASPQKMVTQNADPTVVNQNQNTDSSRNATTVKWKLDMSKAKFHHLTSAEKVKFETFQNAIANQGMSPKDAAAKIGSTDFKLLNKKTGQYQIRLSKAHRVSFLIDQANQTVKVLQVGGHT